MPYHRQGAYDGFDSIKEAMEYYKRCRKNHDFILSDDGAKHYDPRCAHCGKKLSEDDAPSGYRGNRCTYIAKAKKVAVFHYTCAWETTLAQVANMIDYV